MAVIALKKYKRLTIRDIGALLNGNGLRTQKIHLSITIIRLKRLIDFRSNSPHH